MKFGFSVRYVKMENSDSVSISGKTLADVLTADAISDLNALPLLWPFIFTSRNFAEIASALHQKKNMNPRGSQRISHVSTLAVTPCSGVLVLTLKNVESLPLLPNGGELVLHFLDDTVIG